MDKEFARRFDLPDAKYTTKTIHEHCPQITVNRPVLQDEERKRREKNINSEVSRLLWDYADGKSKL